MHKKHICHFENSDLNGLFNLNWMNYEKIKVEPSEIKNRIKEWILNMKKDKFSKLMEKGDN